MSFIVTNIGTNNGLATSISVTAGGTIAAGTDVVVCVSDSNVATTGSCSDSKGNTYTKTSHTSIFNSNGTSYVFTSNVTFGLVLNDTITYTSPSGNNDLAISALSITGANGIDTAVTSTANQGSSTPSVTSGVPAQSGELFIGIIFQTSNATLTQPSGGWTTPPNAALGAYGVSGGNLVNVGSSALTYNPTLSKFVDWGAIIIAYKPAAATISVNASDAPSANYVRRVVRIVST